MPKTQEITQYQDPVLARIYGNETVTRREPVKVGVRVLEERPKREYKLPNLGLRSDKFFVMNGKKINLPVGVDANLTAAQVKQVAKVYRGMVVFAKNGNGWEQVRDNEKIDLNQPHKFETREPPKPDPVIQEFRSVQHYNTD
jgi:hypothetical protein